MKNKWEYRKWTEYGILFMEPDFKGKERRSV